VEILVDSSLDGVGLVPFVLLVITEFSESCRLTCQINDLGGNMSVESALRFIQTVRADPALAGRIQALGTTVDLCELVSLGAEIDIEFTGDELQNAYRYDWKMRLVHLRTRTDRAAPEVSAPGRLGET
jgi:predicted ribosomally synthesized peptide with nif11-like leader